MKTMIQGGLTEHIEGFLKQKHAAGFIFKDGERILRRFSDFCNLRFPDETKLTQTVVDRWVEDGNDYGNTYQMYRMAVVRNLGIYMHGKGLDAYILPEELFPRQSPRYTVHIYTKDELASIFNCADRYPFRKSSPVVHLILPVIFRLLYCCGLRPSEALKLKPEHINLENGEIRIMQSKGLKDRLVVMSPDMLELCIKYNKKMQSLYPDRAFFFTNVRTNDCYKKSWFDHWLNRILDEANSDFLTVSKPRLYDFRHTFATHCIQKWIDEGKDVNAKLLYLSAYMGHKDVTNTAYYIHLIPSEFLKQSKVSTAWYSELSEVENED
jgi:integrase